MRKRERGMAGLEPGAPRERRRRSRDGASTRSATEGRARRHRYLSARAAISLIALASLVVPGIAALIAAAVSAF
jgi:hypothetical protein